MEYVIKVCWQLASRIRTELQFLPDPVRKLSANLYHIYHCCVYSEKTPDERQRNCPKHVEFYSKNKFEKLVQLVGFVIRIYHDARSPERQILSLTSASDVGRWSTPCPGRFTPAERPGTHCTGGWVGPRARCGRFLPPPPYGMIPGPTEPLRVAVCTQRRHLTLV
jgi:hypothetical protein